MEVLHGRVDARSPATEGDCQGLLEQIAYRNQPLELAGAGGGVSSWRREMVEPDRVRVIVEPDAGEGAS